MNVNTTNSNEILVCTYNIGGGHADQKELTGVYDLERHLGEDLQKPLIEYLMKDLNLNETQTKTLLAQTNGRDFNSLLEKYLKDKTGPDNQPLNLDSIKQTITEIKVKIAKEKDGIIQEWNAQQKVGREKVQVVVASKLPQVAHVFCLQEVADNERAEIKALKEAKYEICGKGNDCKIAISTERFKDITDHSFTIPGGADVAFATAIDKKTNKRIAFLSAHIAGFGLEEKDASTMKLDASTGNKECVEIVKMLKEKFEKKEIPFCDLTILGGDLNTPPEIQNERFQPFQNANYDLLRTHEPTQKTTNPRARELFERELDFMHVKGHSDSDTKPFLASMVSRFYRMYNHKRSVVGVGRGRVAKLEMVKSSFDPGFNPNFNSSDHKPTVMKVSVLSHAALTKEVAKDVAKQIATSSWETWKESLKAISNHFNKKI